MVSVSCVFVVLHVVIAALFDPNYAIFILAHVANQTGVVAYVCRSILSICRLHRMSKSVTRAANVPRRWYDQGALMALPIYQVPTRRVSGYLEVALKSYFKDKTQWRQMLQTQQCGVDLKQSIQSVVDQGSLNRYIDEEPLFKDGAPVPIYTHHEPEIISYPVHTRSKRSI